MYKRFNKRTCKMCQYIVVIILFSLQIVCYGQVVLFGNCSNIQTMEHFELERFLGKWYTIERYPTWYEESGECAYKLVQQCGRSIEFQHVFVKNGIEYVLHVNSSYAPGAEAVFAIPENNIDALGIPLSIIKTDYINYAIVYGCKVNPLLQIKYVLAWILSRNTTLDPEIHESVYQQLNLLPAVSLAYLQPVNQHQEYCSYHWTAHVQAIYYNNTNEDLQ